MFADELLPIYDVSDAVGSRAHALVNGALEQARESIEQALV